MKSHSRVWFEHPSLVSVGALRPYILFKECLLDLHCPLISNPLPPPHPSLARNTRPRYSLPISQSLPIIERSLCRFCSNPLVHVWLSVSGGWKALTAGLCIKRMSNNVDRADWISLLKIWLQICIIYSTLNIIKANDMTLWWFTYRHVLCPTEREIT